MKLRNKLIPLMSVLATTTVVAPIATSCGNKMEMVDITKNYVPTIDKAKEQPEAIDDTAAQDIYFDHLAKNPEILKQDIIKYEADILPKRIRSLEYPNSATQQEYIATNVKANVGVSNISFQKREGVIDAAKFNFYTLNVDIKYNFDYTLLNMEGDKEYRDVTTYSMSLKNIPTYMYSMKVATNYGKESSRKWFFSNDFTNTEVLKQVPGWSYTFDRNQTVTTSTIDKYGNKTSTSQDYNKSGSLTRIDQLTGLLESYKQNASDYLSTFVKFQSYHMSDVAGAKGATNFAYNTSEDGQTIKGTYGEWKRDDYGCGFEVNVDLFKTTAEISEQLANQFASRVYLGAPGIVPETFGDFRDAGRSAKRAGDFGLEEITRRSYDYDVFTVPARSGATLRDAALFSLYSSSLWNWLEGEKEFDVSNNMITPNMYRLYTWNGKEYWYNYNYSFKVIDAAQVFNFKLASQGQVIGYAYSDKTGEIFKSEEFELEDDIYIELSPAA